MTEVNYRDLDSITQDGYVGIAPGGLTTSTWDWITSSCPVETITTVNNNTYNENISATDIETGYKIVFNTMCREYPEKTDEWKTLLKVYGGCYRATVLAIDTDLFQNVQKMAQ